MNKKQEFTCNRPAVFLHTLVGVLALAYLFQHLFGEYMLWLAHGTPSLIRVNVQVAIPLLTVFLLGWSSRRHISRLERVFAGLVLTGLGGSYIWIMRWTQEEMQLISKATGAACVLLALGMLIGEFFGFTWLLHPWTVVGIKSLAPTVAECCNHAAKGGKRASCDHVADNASVITQSFSSGDGEGCDGAVV